MKSSAVYQYLAVHLYFTIRQHGIDGDTEASCRCVRAESSSRKRFSQSDKRSKQEAQPRLNRKLILTVNSPHTQRYLITSALYYLWTSILIWESIQVTDDICFLSQQIPVKNWLDMRKLIQGYVCISNYFTYICEHRNYVFEV